MKTPLQIAKNRLNKLKESWSADEIVRMLAKGEQKVLAWTLAKQYVRDNPMPPEPLSNEMESMLTIQCLRMLNQEQRYRLVSKISQHGKD